MVNNELYWPYDRRRDADPGRPGGQANSSIRRSTLGVYKMQKKDGISNSSWHLILELARLRPGLFLPHASVLLQLGHSLPELGEALLSGLEGCRRSLEPSTQLRNLVVNDMFSGCRRSWCIEGEVTLTTRGFVRAPMPHQRHHSSRYLRITPL